MPATDRDGSAAQGARLSQAAVAAQEGCHLDIELREITAATVGAIVRLDAGDCSRQLAPNAVSIAQAHFEPAAWFRAVYATGEPVGFVKLCDPSLASAPESPRFDLWRLMIDKSQQGRGVCRAAVERLIDHVRTRPGAAELYTSRESETLAHLYGALGFRYTGEEDDGELAQSL